MTDLISLLRLDSKYSHSAFGGLHRTILISKDYTNSGDFVFNCLLHHFARKEPNTPTLLVTLSHEWSNYSSCAAKCGSNLRRSQNRGNIDVLNLMSKYIDSMREESESDLNLCKYIEDEVLKFIGIHTQNDEAKPVIVMIDDISILLTIGYKVNEVYRLFSTLDSTLRMRSKRYKVEQLSHLIAQTLFTNYKVTEYNDLKANDDDLNYLTATFENHCDLILTLKPLSTGHSTRVDGTIKIVDNRLPSGKQAPITLGQSISLENNNEIGSIKAFFFKLGDRRVRLTSSALLS